MCTFLYRDSVSIYTDPTRCEPLSIVLQEARRTCSSFLPASFERELLPFLPAKCQMNSCSEDAAKSGNTLLHQKGKCKWMGWSGPREQSVLWHSIRIGMLLAQGSCPRSGGGSPLLVSFSACLLFFPSLPFPFLLFCFPFFSLQQCCWYIFLLLRLNKYYAL